MFFDCTTLYAGFAWVVFFLRVSVESIDFSE